MWFLIVLAVPLLVVVTAGIRDYRDRRDGRILVCRANIARLERELGFTDPAPYPAERQTTTAEADNILKDIYRVSMPGAVVRVNGDPRRIIHVEGNVFFPES